MKVALIGRTRILLDTGARLLESGHQIVFVYTCRSEEYYDTKEIDFEKFANDNSIPFFCDQQIGLRALELGKYQADIAISVNWLTIINDEVLNIFPFGVLNAHAGDLPRFKGNACINWAIINFEKRVCLTIHKMVEELDSGPILLKKYFEIDENTYVNEIFAWVCDAVPELFVEALDGIERGSLKFSQQPANQRSLRLFPRRKEDSRIVWSCSSTRNIMALIRASSHPFSGAYSFLEGCTEIAIFRARIFMPNFDFLSVPGQICMANGENPVVATIDGMIEIEECSSSEGGDFETKKIILKSLRNRFFDNFK